MLTILAACFSMFVRDGLGTMLTVAEARGQAILAGAMDAFGDIASIAVTYFGLDALLTHGLDAHTILLLACIFLTSFAGTTMWTKVSRRIPEVGL
jgi:threonine/homoserine/homoserine lactone efflux protein